MSAPRCGAGGDYVVEVPLAGEAMTVPDDADSVVRRQSIVAALAARCRPGSARLSSCAISRT